MRLRVLAVLAVLSSSAPAGAADGGPPLVELMLRPNYLTAYKTMIGTTTVPPWVTDFAKTLEGPPTPSADLLSDGMIYTLAFTCKPNECAEHQLFVLFTGDGSKAWGLLARPGKAEVFSYPNCRDGRIVADVVRIDKGHTEGLEPKITEELVKMMRSARGGKIQRGT